MTRKFMKYTILYIILFSLITACSSNKEQIEVTIPLRFFYLIDDSVMINRRLVSQFDDEINISSRVFAIVNRDVSREDDDSIMVRRVYFESKAIPTKYFTIIGDTVWINKRFISHQGDSTIILSPPLLTFDKSDARFVKRTIKISLKDIKLKELGKDGAVLTKPIVEHKEQYYILFGFICFIGLIITLLLYIQIGLWLDAKLDRVRVTWVDMWKMRFEGVDAKLIIEMLKSAKNSDVKIHCDELVDLYQAKIDIKRFTSVFIQAISAGVQITLAQLKTHYLSKGNIEKVITALISARNIDKSLPDGAKLNLTYQLAATMDLGGVDVVQAVQSAISHKVISSDDIKAFALDGIELIIKARMTLRTKFAQIISGAKEDTVQARVSEAIVSFVGMTPSHYDILKNPFELGEKVISRKSIFTDTAFDVLSVDIVSIKIGKDIHSELNEERAKSKIVVERANEQEMRAKAQEARAKVIAAEVEVQKAMAAAFIEGNFSIDNYLKMKNIQSDTKMRGSMTQENNEQDINISD